MEIWSKFPKAISKRASVAVTLGTVEVTACVDGFSVPVQHPLMILASQSRA